MIAPITYLQWSMINVSFDFVFAETRHATSCCSKIHRTCLFDAGNISPKSMNSPQVGQILGGVLVNFPHV